MPKEEKEVTTAIAEDPEMFVLRLHAEGVKQEEIAKQLKRTLQFKSTLSEIKSICIRKDNQVFIERYRDDYLSKIKSVPVANKRVRLDDLQRMRNDLFSMLESVSTKTVEGRSETLRIFKHVNEILSIARDEMEGKPWLMQQINITELSNLSDEELQHRKEILIAKATGTYQERNFGLGEIGEGTEEPSHSEPSEISLASPNQL